MLNRSNDGDAKGNTRQQKIIQIARFQKAKDQDKII